MNAKTAAMRRTGTRTTDSSCLITVPIAALSAAFRRRRQDVDAVEEKPMFECFHCGCRSVIWDSDFTFDDCGYEGEGLVQFLHCTSCGAEIEYRISFEKDEPEGEPA